MLREKRESRFRNLGDISVTCRTSTGVRYAMPKKNTFQGMMHQHWIDFSFSFLLYYKSAMNFIIYWNFQNKIIWLLTHHIAKSFTNILRWWSLKGKSYPHGKLKPLLESLCHVMCTCASGEYIFIWYVYVCVFQWPWFRSHFWIASCFTVIYLIKCECLVSLLRHEGKCGNHILISLPLCVCWGGG